MRYILILIIVCQIADVAGQGYNASGGFAGSDSTRKSAAMKANLYLGFSYNSMMGSPAYMSPPPGFDVGVAFNVSRKVALGVSYNSLLTQTESRSVGVASSIVSKKKVWSLNAIIQVWLNPDAKVRFFLEGKVGYEAGNQKVTQDGQVLIFFPTSSTVYQNTSGVMAAGLGAGFVVPVGKRKVDGFRVFGGVTGGGDLKYIDPRTVAVDGSGVTYGPEQTSPGSYWTASLSYILMIPDTFGSKK